MDEQWLATEELIARAGGGVTRSQVERWLKAGLLPRPRRRGLGRGQGTVSLYPPGAVPLLRRLLALQEETRDIGEWRWQLWLDGYPIDAERLRRQLLVALDRVGAEAQTVLADVQPDEADPLGLVEAVLSKMELTRNDRLLRLIRRKLRNPSDWHSLMVFVLSRALGFEPPVAWDDPVNEQTGERIGQLTVRGLGMPQEWQIPDELPGWLSPERIREAIADGTPEEWAAIRRDWEVIAGAVAVLEVVALAVRLPPPGQIAIQGLADDLFRAGVSGFLIQARRSELAGNLDVILTALRLFTATIMTTEQGEPSQLREQLEGVAPGEETSACTATIPPTARSGTAP